MWSNQIQIVFVLLLTAWRVQLGSTISIVITPDSETFAVGQNADIGCVDANPPSAPGNWSTTALSANISNQFVPNAGNFARVTELSLTNVDSGYCGTYTCMFTNPVDSATVSVIVVPAFEESLMGQMVFVETPNLEVSFTCTVNGGAGNTVEIDWSGPVVPDDTMMEIRDGVFMSNLTLTNVTTVFTGTYFCTARYNNSLCTENITSNASLIVVGPPTVINQTPSPLKIDSGVTVYLFFEFSSLPSHTDVQCSGPDGVIGMDNTSGINLERVDFDSAFQIRVDINITSVNYTHGGIYSCIVNNSAGVVEATTLLLVRPVVDPPEVLAKNGDMVTLMCLAQSFPEPSYVWERFRDSNDSDAIPDVFGYVSGSGENMMATHPFLDFEPVRYGDEGVYRCMVKINGTWMASSDGVLLAVSPEGSVTVEAVNMTLLYDPNESVTLRCMASGGPNNTFMWFFNGESIVNETDTLNVTELDGGEYTCRVSNAAGSENASIILTEAPSNVTVVSNYDFNVASLNNNVRLMCSSDGGPNNTYQWMKDGIVLDNETDATLDLFFIDASTGGNYICTVSNLAGNDSGSVTLYVSPYIVTPLEERVLRAVGDNVSVTCEADGFPSPDVVWNQMGMDMTRSNTSLLEVTPVMFGDEGVYQCVASFIITGMVFNATDEITLFVSPEGSVTVSPDRQVANRGGNIALNCSAQGGPNNSYRWKKDGMSIGDNESTLLINDIDASSGGSYTCLVSNAAGNDSASITLYVAPYIVTPLEEQTLTANGSNVNISCDAAGFPSPSVNWVYMMSMEVSNTSLLQFIPVMFGDEGVYCCTASAEINDMDFTATDETTLVVSPEGSVMVSVSNNIANIGSNTTFNCFAMGGPQNIYRWMMNGETIGNESTLLINDIDASSGGSYTCLVSNAAGNESASITLYVAPYIVTPLEEQTLTANGSNVNISCDAAGFPSPSVNWVDTMSMEVSNTPLLQFIPVMFGDEGVYRCVASAEINSMNFTATDETTLVVSPEGSVMVSVSNNIANISSNTTFDCSAMGGPQNIYRWMMNGETIGNESTLVVTDIDASSGGSYTCLVSNAAGNESASTTLYVAPYIVTPLEEQTLTANGSNVNISCDAAGFPSPSVNWVDMMSMEVSNTSLLQFIPVMFGDEGVYRCVATAEICNMNFTATDETTLVVSPETSVDVSPLNTVSSRGNNVTLVCTAMGGPDNTFQWEMEGTVIRNESMSMLKLVDIDASDGGDYTCTVSNAAGNDSASTTLYVAPYIVTPLEELTLSVNGSSINLTCDADGFPEPNVSWDRNTTEDLVANNSLLLITTVLFGQEGVYRCLASVNINGENYEDSDLTTLVVSTEGGVTVSPVDMVFLRGQNVTLSCSSLGGPNNMFQWQKDEEVVANNTLLTLVDIDASSGGDYTCTVSNLAGNDSATTTLYVAPYFVTQPMNVETSNGEEVNITCEAEAFPNPQYLWMKNGGFEMIREGVVIDETPNSLRFRPVMFGDEGGYNCVASITINMAEHNESSNSVVLTVSPEGSIQADPTTINGNHSGNATFSCTAMGGPGNMFSWTNLKSNTVVVNGSELVVVDIIASDGGQYQCLAENLAGSDNTTVTLNVSPVVTEHPPDQNVTSFEGTIMLSCTATGFPAPTITWFHNDTLENSVFYTTEDINCYTTRSTFIKLRAETNDSGTYFCRAEINGYDSVDSNEAIVLVQDIPEQPLNITAVETQSRYLVITWVEPHDNNAPIQGYFVMYNQPNCAGGMMIVQNVSEETLNVTNLYPGVTFNFTVIAYNDIGNSTESETTPLRTLDEAPAGPPQNVTAASLSSTTINVTWEEVLPCDRNGVIITYEVVFEPLETFGQLTSDISNTSDLSILLEDLHPFVNYNISVRAYTSEGSGPFSEDIVEITQQDRPGMPLNVSAMVNSTTEVIVYWQEVLPFNRNGTILLYEVLYQSSTLDQTQSLNTTDNSTFTLLLSGLEEFIEYNITVRAYTEAGAGEESMPVVAVQTPGDIPDPPLPPNEVSMQDIEPFSAIVRWNAIDPRLANGKVINYTVNYRVAEPVTSSSNRKKRQTTSVMLEQECIIGGGQNVDRNLTVDGDQTSAELQNLTPNVRYEVKIQAVNELGAGEFSNTTDFSTSESVPSEPRNLTAIGMTSTSLRLTWLRPLCEYGILTNYTITYNSDASDGSELGDPLSGIIIAPNETVLEISNLTINTAYRVSVVAATSAGTGVTANQTGMTDEDAPQEVTDLMISSSPSAEDSNNVTVTFSWTGPSTRNGSYNYSLIYSGEQVDEYPVERRRNQPMETVTIGGSMMQSMAVNGLPYANYTINVTAFNIKTGRSGPSSMYTDRTIIIEPSQVTDLSAVGSSSESILVRWNLPQYPNGPLRGYRISYKMSTSSSTPDRNSTTVDITNTEYNISGLTAYTNYSIFVEALGDMNVTGMISTEIVERTNATVPIVAIPPTVTPPTTTVNSFVFDLPPATNRTGPLKLYAVIVVRVTQDFDETRRNFDDVGPYDSSNPDGPYVAAAWNILEAVPDTFTIGTDSTTTVDGVTYRNVPLQSNAAYAALVRVEIVSDNTAMRLISYSPFVQAQTNTSSNSAAIAVSIVLVVIVLVCVAVLAVVLLYFYRTKYYLPKREGYAVNDLDMDESTNVQPLSVIQNPALVAKPFGHLFEPIPVEQFKEHVKSLHRNDDYPFSEEYSNVEPSHAPTSEATHYPYNASKNRYANISAYDHSRVKLNEIPGRPGSDYINANYIHGYKLENGFIATQGPVPDSVPDFWRMVWEQNTATIVMVTNLEEKGRVKCHKYWPDEKTNIYGSMRVHIQEILVLAEYTVRTFSLTKDDSKDERIVTQYHYTIWPDHGVPEYPTSLLHFVRKVMVTNPDNAGPIVIHCSAGVGRTGTFITLFNQLRRIDTERNVNVFNFVRSMRRNRCCMVQTESQYIFTHDALLEAIECGVTEVAARDLKEQYKRLGIVDEVVGLTGLEIEFDKLDNTIHRRPTNTFGTLQINKPKNRYANMDMLPYDTSRCRLSFIPGVEGSDYINANFVDGYHKRRAFIATQGPLPDTSDDFWRMVWEQKCATIVMLTKEREGSRVKCHRYWPSTGALNFRQYQIILHAVNEYPDYILREFKIVDTKDGSSLPVKQFQYTGWPEEGIPDAGTGLIDLAGQVQKWQRNSGVHPIVVHCSGGSGRTGTFIAISILLERLKTEGVVDVFHTGRTLRLQRPGLIQTVDQYEFCYKTVLEYLDSFELYANFK